MTRLIRPIYVGHATPPAMLTRLHALLGWRVRVHHNDNRALGPVA